MTPEDFDLLRTPEVRSLLDGLVPYDPTTALQAAERLRRDHPVELVSLAMTQARLRSRAIERFGEQGGTLWWTPDGLEQATRPILARRHAEIFRAAGATCVADIGCGVGIDALSFADAGLRVIAVERDPLTAAVAQANVDDRGVADVVTVVTADAADFDLAGSGCDAVYLDPARRSQGRRLLDPEQWSPRFSTATALASSVDTALIKVAPGLDRTLRPEGVTFEAVSVDGSLLEILLRFGAAASAADYAATVLPADLTMTSAGSSAPAVVGDWGRWLLEPDDAVIRAGLVAPLAAELDGRLADAHVAYITCDAEPPSNPRYARFEIDEVVPFSVKGLRAALRSRDVGRLEIKKRAFAMDPEELRRTLKLKGTQERVVLVTRVDDRPVAVIAWRR